MILKRKLLPNYKKIDYKIILKIKKIIRKKWIRFNKLLIITFLFLISKSKTDKKKLIIDYKKLNEETITDSTLLLLIRNIINQIKK